MGRKNDIFAVVTRPTRICLWDDGAENTRKTELATLRNQSAAISALKINGHTLTVELEDSRTLQVPSAGLGFIASQPLRELRKFRVAASGKAIEWPSLGYKVTLAQLFGV